MGAQDADLVLDPELDQRVARRLHRVEIALAPHQDRNERLRHGRGRLLPQLRELVSTRRCGLKSNRSAPSFASTTTWPPFSSAPKSSSSPSGAFISSWMTRASGRAPLSGS